MKKIIKITSYSVLSLLVVLLLAIGYLLTPWGQSFVTKQAESYLSNKLKTPFTVGKISYKIPSAIGIEDLLVIDQNKDTLLAIGKLDLKINMFALLQSKVDVKGLALEDVIAYMHRKDGDTVYNYQYIIDAFVSANDTTIVNSTIDTTASTTGIALQVVKTQLRNIKFRFNDEMGGTDFELKLNSLDLFPKHIDLNTLHFDVEELLINGVTTSLTLDSSKIPAVIDTTVYPPSTLFLSVNKLSIQNVDYVMDMKTSPMYMKVNVGSLEAKVPKFDLLTSVINAEKLHLDNSNVLIVMGKSEVVAPVVSEISLLDDTSSGWRITSNDLMLKNVNFKMDNNNEPLLVQGMDYAHLDAKQIYLSAQDLLYTSDTISGQVKHLTLSEKSGLQLQEFKTDFVYSNKGAILNNFLLKTPHTLLQNRLSVGYLSLERLMQDLGHMQLLVDLQNSKIGMSDVMLFVPSELRALLLPYDRHVLDLSANINGKLSDLAIRTFKFSGLKGTNVILNGNLKGLPNPELLSFDFKIQQLKTVLADVQPFLPESILQSMNIPEQIAVQGDVFGNMYAYHPKLTIQTSDGNAELFGFVNLKPENEESYDLVLHTSHLNLGKILRQDSVFSTLSSHIVVKGSSFDLKRMNTDVQLDLQEAHALGYNYNNINAVVKIKDGIAAIEAKSDDPNVLFDVKGSTDLNQEYPSVFALLRVNNIDLNAIKLSDDTMRFAGKFNINFPVLNPDFPVGQLTGEEIEVSIPGVKLPLDTMSLVAQSDNNNGQSIIANITNILQLNFTGCMPLTQIGDAVIWHIDRHYQIGDTVNVAASQYDMDLNGAVRYSPLLSRWNRNIKPFETIHLNVALDPHQMNINANIPKLVFGDHVVDSGWVNITENDSRLDYDLGLKHYKKGASFTIYNPLIKGNIQNDTIFAHLSIDDSSKVNQFNFGTAISKNLLEQNSDIEIKLFEGLKFNYEPWYVNPKNQIVYGDKGLKISNFNISQGSQFININSTADTFDSPIAMIIKNLSLSSLTKIISGDTLVADGIVNADVELDLTPQIPYIKGNASIEELLVFNQPLGNILLDAKTLDQSRYSADVTLVGQGNDIKFSGEYYTKTISGNDFNFNLLINPIAIKSIEGLTFGALKNSSGLLKGNLNISGTFSEPKIRGAITTEDITAKLAMTNGVLKMPKETITFNQQGIVFNNFKIYDYKDNSASINGKVITRTYSNYYLNLDIIADKWTPVHSTKKNSDLFYGDLMLSSNINVKGLVSAPNISGSLTVHDDTRLTFALLDSDPQIEETDDILVFTDSKHPYSNYEDTLKTVLNKMRFSKTAQMNVNVNIEKKAAFNLIIDPSTGDNLLVQGDANLNAQIAPNGSIGLVGVYNLADGYYELSFPPVRKKFKIESGSNVILAGDPLAAIVNITAIYKASMAPYELVEKQVSDPAQLVFYKQRLPFEIVLKLNGEAMKPNISFDIRLPENLGSVSSDVSSLVQSRLSAMRNNSSEMNKQVFAAIVLNKFIAESPFNSGSPVDVEFLARQSVSRFLSSQLNKAAGQFITGLDLNLDLESSDDYSSGQKANRTDLNISAKKTLFDDRLSITIGNDFMIEGSGPAKNNTGIPDNITADYKLTADDRYSIRAYRKNELQNLIDGYVVETGIGLRMGFEYNKFKYIFVNRKKYQEKQKAKREKEAENQKGKAEAAKQKNDVPLTSYRFIPNVLCKFFPELTG